MMQSNQSFEFRKVGESNNIVYVDARGYYQLLLSAEYRQWLTQDDEEELMLHIYHHDKENLELLKARIEKLYEDTIQNVRLIQTINRKKKFTFTICLLLLILINVLLAAFKTRLFLNTIMYAFLSVVAIVYLTLALGRMYQFTPNVPWRLPFLGITKHEKRNIDLMWEAYKLRMDIKADFNPLGL